MYVLFIKSSELLSFVTRCFAVFVLQAKPECCVSGDTELKRFEDIDYDSFVSLMGRRSAAQLNSELIFLQRTPRTLTHWSSSNTKLFLQVTETARCQEKVWIRSWIQRQTSIWYSSVMTSPTALWQHCNTFSVDVMQDTWIRSSLICWGGKQVSDLCWMYYPESVNISQISLVVLS